MSVLMSEAPLYAPTVSPTVGSYKQLSYSTNYRRVLRTMKLQTIKGCSGGGAYEGTRLITLPL